MERSSRNSFLAATLANGTGQCFGVDPIGERNNPPGLIGRER